MNFKDYEEVIKNHKYDMLFLIIYHMLKCNDDFKNLKDDEIEKIIHFVHRLYLKDDNHVDLGFMCDVCMENKKDILDDNCNTWDILTLCYERI